jgi:hypothetical protein
VGRVRNGGEKRGNSYDRKARRLFLLVKFGDGETAPCWECSVTVDFSTLVVDRIKMGVDGGKYTRDNIRPHCKTCSDLQGYNAGIGANVA